MNENIYTLLETVNYKRILVNISVGVGMMSFFLTVFYYYYVLEIEHVMLVDNINVMTFNLIDSVKPFITPYIKDFIEKKLINSDMKDQDDNVRKSNASIKNESITNMTFISVICLTIGYILSRQFNINFYTVIRNNFIILILLAFTEYSFLHILPSKIITGDPNFIKYKILVNLKNKMKFQK